MVLLLSILIVMTSSTEFLILNDSLGILVISQMHSMSAKLFLEDFKVVFNKIYNDYEYLRIKLKFESYKPIFSVMEMFRPMFFVMVVALLLLWNSIFALLQDMTTWHFRYFVIFWIMMLAVTELIFTCYGEKTMAFLSRKKKGEETSDGQVDDLENQDNTSNNEEKVGDSSKNGTKQQVVPTPNQVDADANKFIFAKMKKAKKNKNQVDSPTKKRFIEIASKE